MTTEPAPGDSMEREVRTPTNDTAKKIVVRVVASAAVAVILAAILTAIASAGFAGLFEHGLRSFFGG